jgi:hypothetical protein
MQYLFSSKLAAEFSSSLEVSSGILIVAMETMNQPPLSESLSGCLATPI